jgi:hypothetical protein
MSVPEEPAPSGLPHPAKPMRELLLAQALDACIRGERRSRGSAAAIIAKQPRWARDELQRLVDLAGSLDTAATNAVISDEFRTAARARLMQRIGAEPAVAPMQLAPHLSTVPSRNGHHRVSRRRKSTWIWRGSAGLLAAVLAVAATLTASASALPGEPLYGLKQAQEELGVRLASDDQARALALLHRADARLDETARLLQLGRTDEALVMTLRYDHVVERATTTYVVTIDDTPEASPAAAHIDTRLSQQQDQLQSMLETAPEQARGDLRDALVATERSRALVADPRPVERALGRTSGRGAVAAAPPTVTAEEVPTVVPTRRPTLSPTQPVLAEQQHGQILAQVVPADPGGRGGEDDNGGASGHGDGDGGTNARPQVANVTSNSGRGVSNGSQQPVRSSNSGDDHMDGERNAEQSPVQPALVARDDRGFGLAVPQTNLAVPRTQADGRGSPSGPQPQANDRSREEDTPPAVVARPQTAPAQTAGSGAATRSNENTTPARLQAPAPAVGAAQTDKGVRDTADDGRAAPSMSTGSASRPLPTPTMATVKKSSGDDTKPSPTPTSRNAGGDNNNGGGGTGGADHPGH